MEIGRNCRDLAIGNVPDSGVVPALEGFGGYPTLVEWDAAAASEQDEEALGELTWFSVRPRE